MALSVRADDSASDLPQELILENYFNYFTEIEEHFQRRRGTLSILSPLDWALLEMWKDAGIPLEAVLRGIDVTFDKWERRPNRTRRINGLAFCSQEVLASAEELKEAAVGATAPGTLKPAPGLDHAAVSEFLTHNAEVLERLQLPDPAQPLAAETARTLHGLAKSIAGTYGQMQMEDLERRLTVAEDKLLAALLASTADEAIVKVHSEADRDLTPYRSKMNAQQIDQLHKQYVHKRLLERYKVPRLSLFYM